MVRGGVQANDRPKPQAKAGIEFPHYFPSSLESAEMSCKPLRSYHLMVAFSHADIPAPRA
jgi:hypothetical protein